MYLDQYCKRCIDNNSACIYAWLLMSSYAYYHEDDPILSDEFYDRLCNKLCKEWDELPEHYLKGFIRIDDLKAGSLFSLKQDAYPWGLIRALHSTRRKRDRGEYETIN